MNRVLRSNRGKKEDILKVGVIILCRVETD